MRKNKRKSRKKSYNPFKMWGSYLGLVLSLILPLSTILSKFITLDWLFPIIYTNPIAILFQSILGFLIGWKIHSLFRRFWK